MDFPAEKPQCNDAPASVGGTTREAKDGVSVVRGITAFLPVTGDPVALHGVMTRDPGAWLPDSRHIGEDRWTMVVRGAGLTRIVAARIGTLWWTGSTLWRSVSWEPSDEAIDPERLTRLLPSLDGELGLHGSGDVASLVLEGRYQPPGGHLGATVDALALHRVAQNTVDRLLADIAERLCEIVEAEAPVEAPVEAPSNDGDPSATES